MVKSQMHKPTKIEQDRGWAGDVFGFLCIQQAGKFLNKIYCHVSKVEYKNSTHIYVDIMLITLYIWTWYNLISPDQQKKKKRRDIAAP